MDLNSIPQEAFEKLKDCKTTDDVIGLGREYGIELELEDAEEVLAALAAGEITTETYGDCFEGCTYCVYDTYIHEKNGRTRQYCTYKERATWFRCRNYTKQ